MHWYEPEPEPECIINDLEIPCTGEGARVESLTYVEGLEFCAFAGCHLGTAELDEWNKDLALQNKYPHI